MFTRMLSLPHSSAATRASWVKAAFVAEYAAAPGPGAGTFFGSLFVAGVILPNNIKELMEADGNVVIRDSKKMSQKKREYAEEFIKRNSREH